VFRFGFLQVLSRVPPVVLGDPKGCPRQTHWLGSARLTNELEVQLGSARLVARAARFGSRAKTYKYIIFIIKEIPEYNAEITKFSINLTMENIMA
jgi:hypothetical protein